MLRGILLATVLAVPVLCQDWYRNEPTASQGAGWRAGGGRQSVDALTSQRSAAANVAGQWGLENAYGAQDARQFGAAQAQGVSSRGIAGEEVGAYKTLEGHDKGYEDAGFRDERGRIEYGRDTRFGDSARDAHLELTVESSGGRVLDADRAGYAGAVSAQSRAGNANNVGSLWDRRAAASGLSAAGRGAVGLSGWGSQAAVQKSVAPKDDEDHAAGSAFEGNNFWNNKGNTFQAARPEWENHSFGQQGILSKLPTWKPNFGWSN